MSARWLDDLTVSQETSMSLLARAQGGDAVALEALMGRYLPRLQRWAHGRLPDRARSLLDTDDLVQTALLNTFRRFDDFRPRHDGALLAYLRQVVANHIRNAAQRLPPAPDGSIDVEDLHSNIPSPLADILTRERYDRYEQALAALDDDERAAIVGRFEMGYSFDALARAIDRPSPDAARKLTERAVRRLIAGMQRHGD